MKGSLLQRKTVFFSRLFRLSTKLLRLKQGPSSAGRDGELEDTIQELEARVATLESQKGALQSKLSLAKQHILDLGVRTHYRPRTGEGATGYDKVVILLYCFGHW